MGVCGQPRVNLPRRLLETLRWQGARQGTVGSLLLSKKPELRPSGCGISRAKDSTEQMIIAQSKIGELAETVYRARTPKSSQLFEAAKAVLPGGDTRSVLYFPPYPTFVERGRGCRVSDVDGNEYIDFLNNYAQLIHGHILAMLVEAVCNQAMRGSAFVSR